MKLSVIATNIFEVVRIQVIKVVTKGMLYYQVGCSRGKKRFGIHTWIFFTFI